MPRRDAPAAVLELHTDPRWGSAYWCDHFRRRGLRPADVLADPLAAGLMDSEELRRRPLEDFVPRRLLEAGTRLITSETSGLTGKPVVTAFTETEFHAAFVEPFLRRAEETGFPLRVNWLWAGPTGPHAIGKAVHAILRAVGGRDPFSIDFDPRWFRKLPENSVGRQRYLAHVGAQVMDILETQRVEALFTTPPVIRMLIAKWPPERRAAIRGVHYGGMGITAAEYREFHAAFPNAVHLHGYGNSMFGVFVESGFGPEGIEYRTASPRLRLDLVQDTDGGGFRTCAPGEIGRVMLSRFDESFLILNHLERDLATRIPDGIRDPHPPNLELNRKIIY